MYDPVLARFVSADSVVPGNASGSLQGIALKPLTVDFHEVGFGATLNRENGQPCWFQLSDTQRQQVGDPWGPQNPQALNRYSYVQNNAVKYIDPSGHSARCKRLFGYDICLAAVNVVNNSDYPIEVTGDSWDEDCQCYQTKTVVVGPGESSRDHGIADADQVRTIRAEHDGVT